MNILVRENILYICLPDKISGVLYPTKDGMVLTGQQFIDLVYYLEDIKAALDTEDGDVSKRHIGKKHICRGFSKQDRA